uniref:Chymotrypsin BII n=1 Tax=Aceria tosichella TaxID=561515 RepID=A0A6G1S875_9ACAR
MTRKNYLILAMIISHLIIGEIGMCKKIKIDADNHRICGKSNMRQWQHHQSAYDCDDDDDWLDWLDWLSAEGKIRSKRAADGHSTYEGEFPSAVKLIKTNSGGKNIACGGTLIHSDLVITSARCIHDAKEIEVQLGSTKNDNAGGVSIKADNWCFHSKWSSIEGPYNLGIVRLSRDVKYISGKIWPACLRLSQEHKSKAVCSAVGFGWDKPGVFSSELQSFEVKRKCHSSDDVDRHVGRSITCYSSEVDGGACPGDQGSGLYCFGRVHPCDSNIKRTFVVGALAWTVGECNPGAKHPQYYTDFYKNRRAIRNMVNTLVGGEKVKEDHTCKRW